VAVCGRAVPRQALGERIVLTIVVLALLAVCITLVVAPWAPERAETAAALFGVAAPSQAVCAPDVTSRRETGSGAHLAGSPVSIPRDRTAAAD
jgi:hypothetical protein